MFINSRNSRTGFWAVRATVSALAGATSLIVVLVFATVKFTEGAWLIVLLGPALVFFMYRFHLEYEREQAVLNISHNQSGTPSAIRHEVAVLVDSVDLAVTGAVAYARSLKPRKIEAVHFVLDDQRAEMIRSKWANSPALSAIPLKLIDCPDRRLQRTVARYAKRSTVESGAELTLVLPRRIYTRLLGRILHDQTAEHIAAGVGKIPNVVATIIPFDVATLIQSEESESASPSGPINIEMDRPENDLAVSTPSSAVTIPFSHFEPNLSKIGEVKWRRRSHVLGQVVSVTSTHASPRNLAVELWDETGGITLFFLGREALPGVTPGSYLKAEGMVGEKDGKLTIMNPRYELLIDPSTKPRE
jgi:hypothetical protein